MKKPGLISEFTNCIHMYIRINNNIKRPSRPIPTALPITSYFSALTYHPFPPFSLKAISPGTTCTEFRGRAKGVDDIEESKKKEYDHLTEV